MRKYLVVAPAWVGDMIMAQTLFKFLKQLDPECVIDVVAPGSTLSLAALMPEIRQSFLLAIGHGQLGLSKRYQLGKKLRTLSYDQVIVLPNSLKSALVGWFAGIPQRTGWLGEQRYGLLNDHRRLHGERYPKMIQRFCALALQHGATLPDELPQPQLAVTPQQAHVFLTKYGMPHNPEKPVVVLCPGAAYGPAKRWPVQHFSVLAQQQLELGRQVWLLGGPSEKMITAEIQANTANSCLDFSGKTTLQEVAHLLTLADVVVTNDSGLMHMAAAVPDLAVIALYGSSSPRFTPPLSPHAHIVQQDLACRPCFKRQCPLDGEEHMACLQTIIPQQISLRIAKILATS